jgi:hypothetical protein
MVVEPVTATSAESCRAQRRVGQATRPATTTPDSSVGPGDARRTIRTHSPSGACPVCDSPTQGLLSAPQVSAPFAWV